MILAGESPGVVLDTCAVIWVVNGQPISPAAIEAVARAGTTAEIGVSVVTAWEIGLLSRRKLKAGGESPIAGDPLAWFATLLRKPGIRLLPLTVEIAIATSLLPGNFHADPADRMLVATARHLALPVVTRDRRIIDYAEQGHVGVIVC